MSTPLSIVTWKWTPTPGYRSTFDASHVNTLFRMVDRHYPHPHRRICITDDPTGIDPAIETLPLWDEFAHVPSPHGPKGPSCYRRLRLFDPSIGALLGPRFVSIDLDVVVTQDLTPVWHRPEPIVLYGNTHPTTPYNGSMLLMSAGARPQVWQSFQPESSPAAARQRGFYGSDQAWISHCLGPDEPIWRRTDGVYSFRLHVKRANGVLMRDCRIVIMHGGVKPWDPDVRQRYAFIAEHYR